MWTRRADTSFCVLSIPMQVRAPCLRSLDAFSCPRLLKTRKGKRLPLTLLISSWLQGTVQLQSELRNACIFEMMRTFWHQLTIRERTNIPLLHRTIALSFFASSMGAWVVYAPTELGANPELSWIAVIGYAIASASPAVLVFFIGPSIRKITGEKAFSTTDFGLVRYGRLTQLCIAVMSVFYMFIYMVAELTAISNIFGLVCNIDTFDTTTIRYTTSIAVSVAVFTWFYTSIAGLPGSLVTDKFQAWVMFILIFILLVVACTNPANQLTKEEFSLASNWTGDGAMAAVTLIIAVLCAEMFNQATWQRVWAAKDVPAMRKGFAWGSFSVFLLMMFFGIMGMIAFALDPDNYLSYNKFYCELNFGILNFCLHCNIVSSRLFLMQTWLSLISLHLSPRSGTLWYLLFVPHLLLQLWIVSKQPLRRSSAVISFATEFPISGLLSSLVCCSLWSMSRQ